MKTSFLLYLLLPVLGVICFVLGLHGLAFLLLWVCWGSVGTYIYILRINPHVSTNPQNGEELMGYLSLVALCIFMGSVIGIFGVIFGGIMLLLQWEKKPSLT